MKKHTSISIMLSEHILNDIDKLAQELSASRGTVIDAVFSFALDRTLDLYQGISPHDLTVLTVRLKQYLETGKKGKKLQTLKQSEYLS